ncbi:hypothetical protein U8607_18015 [Methylobacterium durans]|uniref:hypothetical protein n=1 Tax=Methylobacterium durans TaxID=2202825 RepID=UPI002AFE71FF|nr:hypothetical protein [Methylobacterium durans]MEA1833987.1 hypothetical protein [Methylobacterium durans]
MPVLLSRPVRATSLALALAASWMVAPAEARAGKKPAAQKPATAEPAATASVTAAAKAPGVTWTAGEAPAANCTRSRRKLWQEGEGWIVRTVTACR